MSRHRSQIFSPICEKKLTTKCSGSIFLWAKDIIKTRKFGFSVTAQVTKLIWFNFSKEFLVHSDELSIIFETIGTFTVILQKIGANLRFLNTRNASNSYYFFNKKDPVQNDLVIWELLTLNFDKWFHPFNFWMTIFSMNPLRLLPSV